MAMALAMSKATRQFHGQGCNDFNGLLYIVYAKLCRYVVNV